MERAVTVENRDPDIVQPLDPRVELQPVVERDGRRAPVCRRDAGSASAGAERDEARGSAKRSTKAVVVRRGDCHGSGANSTTGARTGANGLRSRHTAWLACVPLELPIGKGGLMAERDGYIPGVPCWVDTSQPDPDAAAAFYSGLFGWEVEDLMPPGSPGKYLVARLRGGDVAAISTAPEGATGPADWNTYVWVDSADETASRVRRGGRNRRNGAVRRLQGRPDGECRRHRGSHVLGVAGERAPRSQDRQRAGRAHLQRSQHPRPRGRGVLLRRRVRMGDVRPPRRQGVDPPRLR